MDRDDRFDLREPQLLERDDLVDPVEQLRSKRYRDLVVLQVRRQDDQRVAKIDRASFRVGDAPVVENLQQNRRDVGVRLFQLVEKHDAVRPAPHRLGELAGLVVTGVSRRRAEQPRNGVRLGELGEIDAHQRGLAAEERLGERFRELGFSDAARAAKEKASQRLARIVQTGARAPNRFGDGRDRAILTDDAFGEQPFEIEQSTRLAIRSATACGMPVQRVTTAATSLAA